MVVIIIRIIAKGMSGFDQRLGEVIVCRITVKQGNGIVISCAVLPLNIEVMGCIGIRLISQSGNVCRGQGLTKVGVDGNGLDQIVAQIIEVNGVQILLILYCIVGEVAGGEHQCICTFFNVQIGCTGLTNEINVTVELACIVLERNGNGSLTCVELGADQVKAVNCGIISELNGGGPLGLFADQRRYCKSDIILGCMCQNVAQCSIVKYDADCVCTVNSVVTGNNGFQGNLAVHFSQLEDGRNDSGCGQAVIVQNVIAKDNLVGVAVANYGSIAIIVLNCIELCLVSSVLGSDHNLGSPTCKDVGCNVVHGLGGSIHGGKRAVCEFTLKVDLTVYDKGNGCSILSYVGSVSGNFGKRHAKALPALEVQAVQLCIEGRNLAVCVFLGLKVAENIKGNGVVSDCFVKYNGIGCICNNYRQFAGVYVAVSIHPALEGEVGGVVAILNGQLATVYGVSAECEQVAEQYVALLVYESDGVLVNNLLNGNNGISSGHGNQLVAVLVKCNQRVALFLQIREVRSELCACRQEALEDQVALFIHELYRVQVCKGYAEGHIRGDVTGGNVIAKDNRSAVSSDGYLVKNLLEPCTGVVSCVERKAEYAVTLIGVGQLSILELLGDQVEHQINGTISQVESSLCLCGLGNLVLELSKCLNHALNDCLCAVGADVQLVCNTCNSALKTCAADKCVCILKLGQSCQIIICNSLGQVVYRLEGKGSFLTVNLFGNSINQNVTELLDQLESGACSLDLFKQSLLALIQCVDVIEQVFHNLYKLVILKQIKQSQKLANGCALAQTCNDSLLGLIGYSCVVESLGQGHGERAGNENVHVEVTTGRYNVINGSKNCLCALADRLEVAAQSDVELYAIVLLALSTQSDVVSADHAVVLHVCNVTGRNGIGE